MTDSDFQPRPLLRLLNTSWPLFRAFRVNVRVSWTILLIPLVFVIRFAKWLPVAEAVQWGAAWTLGLYATVWLHEMGHIWMGRRCGIETDRITLRALGGLAHLQDKAQSPADDIRISLAGPATHLAWMAVLFPLTWALSGAHGGTMWMYMLRQFAAMQLSLMVFNLLPIYPSDGGRTLMGVLSLRLHANRAAYHTATAGFVGNGCLIAAGLVALFTTSDSHGVDAWGFILIWLGIEGIRACRQLRMEAKYGDIYGDHDPFQKTLLASQAALRGADADEAKERAARAAAREERRRLQEVTDRLLDRINEVGGIENLSAKERKELERASRALAEDRNGGGS
jgi:Zn-dependent protease